MRPLNNNDHLLGFWNSVYGSGDVKGWEYVVTAYRFLVRLIFYLVIQSDFSITGPIAI